LPDVQQREILGVRIMIADQRIEDHVVEQAQDLRRTGACRTAHQIEALGQIRAAFVLVFHFRHHAQRLAEILLMKALPVPLGIDQSVVALNQQERAIQRPGELLISPA
jgi:hypothetical protein